MTFVTAVVEPGPALAAHRLARYSRQLAMPGFDETAQRRLAAARVLVVGAGGLGSASIPYLASAGIGTIGIIDTDVVELSNLHRQVSHRMSDLGVDKVDSIARTIAEIDPEIVVHPHALWLDSSNALELFAQYDLILDGSDNFATRYLVNDAAALTNTPVVWGAILRYSGQSGVVYPGHGPSYRDLFPVPPAPTDALSCSVGGVLPTVCAVIGSIMSTEAIKLITGIGQPLIGRVTTYDALSGRFREISYQAIPEAEPITELIDYELFCGRSTAGRSTSARGNAEASSPQLSTTPRELAQWLSEGHELQLIDVREPFEAQIAQITGSELIPLGTIEHAIDKIRRDVPVVLYCHYDSRSQHAAGVLRKHGITNLRWLEGGIDAYATIADDGLARY
jgi:molybdopterin/thiamine biosynthesis adenylyltransferase/rhodanese-related sulfurtransferase